MTEESSESKLYDVLTKVFPYFILPILAIYSIELIEFIFLLAKLGCALVISVFSLGYLVGFIAGAMSALADNGKPDWIKFNLVSIIVTIRWGFDLGHWLMSEEDSNGDVQEETD